MAVKKCLNCNEEKSIAHYIANDSFIHNGSLPICRECITNIIAAAPQDEQWNTVDKLCQWADIPFIPEEWAKIYKGHGKEAFGVYASIFRGQPYNTLNWKQYNDVYLQIEEEERVEDAIPSIKESQRRKLLTKWGQDYDDEELEYLENLHQGLINSQNIVGAVNEDQALKLCKISLIIEQKIRAGSDFSKDLKAYDDLCKLANISSKNFKDANEFNSVGEIFAYLEKTGWQNQYYDDVVRDEVDYTIKDIKYWLQYLYITETGIPEEIEQRIKNLKISAKLSGQQFNEKELKNYIKNQKELEANNPSEDEEFEFDI